MRARGAPPPPRRRSPRRRSPPPAGAGRRRLQRRREVARGERIARAGRVGRRRRIPRVRRPPRGTPQLRAVGPVLDDHRPRGRRRHIDGDRRLAVVQEHHRRIRRRRRRVGVDPPAGVDAHRHRRRGRRRRERPCLGGPLARQVQPPQPLWPPRRQPRGIEARVRTRRPDDHHLPVGVDEDVLLRRRPGRIALDGGGVDARLMQLGDDLLAARIGAHTATDPDGDAQLCQPHRHVAGAAAGVLVAVEDRRLPVGRRQRVHPEGDVPVQVADDEHIHHVPPSPPGGESASVLTPAGTAPGCVRRGRGPPRR
jgi:hypothetical protein